MASGERAGFQPRLSAFHLSQLLQLSNKFWRGAAHNLGVGASWDWGAFTDLGELEEIFFFFFFGPFNVLCQFTTM